MRHRAGLWIVIVMACAAGGCEPPEVVPMTPPGIAPTRIVHEEPAEALGEQNARGTVSVPGENKAAQPAPAPDPTTVRQQTTPLPMGRP